MSFNILYALQDFDTEASLHSKIFLDEISARKLSGLSKRISWRNKLIKDLLRSVVYNSLSAMVDKFGKFVSSVLRGFALFKFTGSLLGSGEVEDDGCVQFLALGVKYECKVCFGLKSLLVFQGIL